MALQNEEWSRMDEIVAYSPCLEEVPTADGIVCERNLHHFLCGTCVRKEMQKILENVQEEILGRSTERKEGVSVVQLHSSAMHRTLKERLRAFYLTRSSRNTALRRMQWWSSACMSRGNSAFRSNLKF
jgi:hypothetical protein